MEHTTKQKPTKYESVMKWMGITFIALFATFFIWLFDFKISFLKINDSNPQ